MKEFLTLTILVLMSVTAVAQYIDGAALLIPGTIFLHCTGCQQL